MGKAKCNPRSAVLFGDSDLKFWVWDKVCCICFIFLLDAVALVVSYAVRLGGIAELYFHFNIVAVLLAPSGSYLTVVSRCISTL